MYVPEQPEEPRRNSFTVDDPRLWEFRSQLSPEEFAIPDLTDEERDAFFAALKEA